jgi:hypothetical protein
MLAELDSPAEKTTKVMIHSYSGYCRLESAHDNIYKEMMYAFSYLTTTHP